MKNPVKKQLLFGTGGIPLCSKARDPASGVKTVAELGLSAMELEFVHGVRINDTMLEKTRKVAEESGITLTCHGPYYINLNAVEKEKRRASIRRILDTARVAHRLGATSITFHAAFYLKEDPQKVHNLVKESLEKIVETLDRENISVQIRPELTGKTSQYGSLEELLRLSTEIKGVLPCIDFSHLHARSSGSQNSLKEFQATLKSYSDALGKDSLKDLHIHVSGIAYSAKGEQRHLVLEESDLKVRQLLKALKSTQAAGVLICESPNLEEDALLMQRIYRKGMAI